MLELSELTAHYGPIKVLKQLNLKVDSGEIVALIGSNGAGKTSTLRVISGLLAASSGAVRFNSQDILNLRPEEIVQLGLSQVPEGRKVFSRLSVLENLMLGSFLIKDRELAKQDLEFCFTLFPILAERRSQSAGTLSGGEQQMLALCRALMSRPKMLLLDEPSMGIAPKLVQKIFEAIVELNKQGMTMLLVEQNANLALQIAHRGYVLETGEITMQGQGQELANSQEVRNAYLAGGA